MKKTKIAEIVTIEERKINMIKGVRQKEQNEKAILVQIGKKKLHKGEKTKSEVSYMQEVWKNMFVETNSELASKVLCEFTKGKNSPFKTVNPPKNFLNCWYLIAKL